MNTDYYTFYTLVGIIPALLFGYLEGTHLKKGNYIQNNYKAIRNTAFAIIGIIGSYLITKDCVLTLSLLFCGSASYYLVFDYALNYFWGKPIFYIGDTALTDKLLKRLFKTNINQYVFLFKFWIWFLSVIIFEILVEYL